MGYGGGDEVRLLEGHLHGTRALIGVGHNRVEIATMLLNKHGVMGFDDICSLTRKFYLSDKLGIALEGPKEYFKGIGVILLDDGMQHRKLCRDVEIVLVNAVSLFGNEMLLPFGPLREPLDALSRADILIIHHASLVSCSRLDTVKYRLTPLLQPETVIFLSQMVPRFLIRIPRVPSDLQHIVRDCSKKSADLLVPLDIIRGAHVLCISGIGCPESLALTLKQLGAVCIERMDFPDHHNFQAQDILIIKQRLSDLKSKLKHLALVVLTEKDYARNPEMFGTLQDSDVFILHSTFELINDSGADVNLRAIIAQKIHCLKSEMFGGRNFHHVD